MIKPFLNKILFSARRQGFILLAILSLISAGVRAEYQLLDKVVAIAEDDVILASEVREKMFVIKTGAANRGNALPPDSVLYEQILERLILDKLQLQRAHKIGLRIPDQELNEAMQRMAAQNGLSLGDFRQALEDQGQSYIDLREQTRENILLQRIQQRSVMRSISISPSEIANFLESEQAKSMLVPEYSIDHLLLPLDSSASNSEFESARNKILALKKIATNKSQFVEIANQIDAAGATHSPLGWRGEDDIPSIFVDAVKSLNVGQVSDPIRSDSGLHLIRINQKRGGIAEQSTETLVSHILLKEMEIRSEEQSIALMDDIISQLNNGANFAELARKHSDDPGSALKGGSLGWTLPGVMVPEFEEMMKHTAVGETSRKFKTQFGWHILYVADRRTKDMSKENAEKLARIEIAKSKYDDELNNWLQELRDNAFVEIK